MKSLRNLFSSFIAAFLLMCLVPPIQASASTDTLYTNQALSPGGSIRSSNGQYTLTLLSDGNLVEYGNGCAVWNTVTYGQGSSGTLVMQSDGNLVLYNPFPTARWASNTWGSNARLVMQNDGNVVIYATQGTNTVATWAVGAGNADHLCAGGTLYAGQYIHSNNANYNLQMQQDGNLVLYNHNGSPVWYTATTGSNNRLVMQTDGNLVLYSPTNAALWYTKTGGTGSNNFAKVQTDGNFVVYTANGTPVWAWEGMNNSPSNSGNSNNSTLTAAEASAVNWAESMIGNSAGLSGGSYWYGCLAFALNAYIDGASYPIRNNISITVGSNTYPAQVWGNFKSGTVDTNPSDTPPPGALVFWNSTGGIGDSHVAVSVGNGNLVSTNTDQPNVPGYNGIHYETMSQFASNSWNIYQGWWLPDR